MNNLLGERYAITIEYKDGRAVKKAALGFIMTKTLAAEMTMKPQYTLPGLDNFYMIGQWVKGFGVPMAAASGKEVIKKICKADGRKFRVE